MPQDNEQRRATANAAAGQAMIDPFSYWKIMDESRAEEIAGRTIAYYKGDPNEIVKDMSDELFNRDAYVDLDTIKHGGSPEWREELDEDYFSYLNKFALSGALDPDNPKLDMDTKQRIASFINAQLARGSKMLGLQETQIPTPDDINAHNAKVDEHNAAAAAMMKGMPPPPPAGPDAAAAPAGPPPMPPIAKGATPPAPAVKGGPAIPQGPAAPQAATKTPATKGKTKK
jgi:hypothetical protein